MQVSDAIELVC